MTTGKKFLGHRQSNGTQLMLFENGYVLSYKVREEIEVGTRINGEKLGILRFANDIAVTTDNLEDLQNILEIMNLAMKNEYNIKINNAKTKVIVYSHNE